MKPLRVLIGCATSCVALDAFLALGHDAWQCDLLPADKPTNRHIQAGRQRGRADMEALLREKAEAKVARLRELLSAVETATATGDGLATDETIRLHQFVHAALNQKGADHE